MHGLSPCESQALSRDLPVPVNASSAQSESVTVPVAAAVCHWQCQCTSAVRDVGCNKCFKCFKHLLEISKHLKTVAVRCRNRYDSRQTDTRSTVKHLGLH